MSFSLNYQRGSPKKKWNLVWKGVSLRSGLTFIWYSIISKHLFAGFLLPASPSKKMAGFRVLLLAIMAPIGFSSYCTLKLLFSRVTVLPQV
jgi:hypothetical protein